MTSVESLASDVRPDGYGLLVNKGLLGQRRAPTAFSSSMKLCGEIPHDKHSNL